MRRCCPVQISGKQIKVSGVAWQCLSAVFSMRNDLLWNVAAGQHFIIAASRTRKHPALEEESPSLIRA